MRKFIIALIWFHVADVSIGNIDAKENTSIQHDKVLWYQTASSGLMSEIIALHWKSSTFVTCLEKDFLVLQISIADIYIYIYITTFIWAKIMLKSCFIRDKIYGHLNFRFTTVSSFFPVVPLKIIIPWLSLAQVPSRFVDVPDPLCIIRREQQRHREGNQLIVQCSDIWTVVVTNRKTRPRPRLFFIPSQGGH